MLESIAVVGYRLGELPPKLSYRALWTCWQRTRVGDVGWLLFCGQTRPGATRDPTQVRQAGLVELLALIPGATPLADAGYQGLGTRTAGAVITPRPTRRKNQIPVFPAVAAAHEAERRAQLSRCIPVGHCISHLKNWRALPRHLGRREHLGTMLPAVVGLVSSQERASQPEQPHRPPKALPAGTPT